MAKIITQVWQTLALQIKNEKELSSNYLSSVSLTAAAGVRGGMMLRTGKVRTDTNTERQREAGRTRRRTRCCPLTMRIIKSDCLSVSHSI